MIAGTGGVLLTEIVTVALPDAPSGSRTVSRARYVPPAGYVWLAVTPVASSVPLPSKSHA